MFIYLVAVIATLFLIFGLVHARYLNDWLRSSACCSLSLYNGLIRRPRIEASLNNDLESTTTTITSERLDYEELPTQRMTFSNKERLSDALLGEAGSRARSLNPPRYSFENILSEEKDKDFGLPGARPLQVGTTQDDTIRTSKQEAKENIFESLKSSIERTTATPYSRLNTSQIYNIILKEKLKENAVKQKLLESDRSKFNDSLTIKMLKPYSSAIIVDILKLVLQSLLVFIAERSMLLRRPKMHQNFKTKAIKINHQSLIIKC